MKKDKHITPISLEQMAIVGAAKRASEAVKATVYDVPGNPVMYEENGAIYRTLADGSAELVKRLPQAEIVVPNTFTI